MSVDTCAMFPQGKHVFLWASAKSSLCALLLPRAGSLMRVEGVPFPAAPEAGLGCGKEAPTVRGGVPGAVSLRESLAAVEGVHLSVSGPQSWWARVCEHVSEQPPCPLWASVLLSGVPLSLGLLQVFKSSTFTLDPECWEGGGKPLLSHGHPFQLQTRSEAQRAWGCDP